MRWRRPLFGFNGVISAQRGYSLVVDGTGVLEKRQTNRIKLILQGASRTRGDGKDEVS